MQSPRTVLVVDDHPEVREALHEFLQLEGYTVYTANHGQEALMVLQQMHHPWVVLTDLTMPVMDGATLAHTLANRLTESLLPVILMTGSAPHRLLESQLFFAYLRKPLNLDSLLDVLDDAFVQLGYPRQHSANLATTAAAL